MSDTLRTLVIQSYRTTGVPGWMADCMALARAWAAARGYEYRFVDDSLFEHSPRWYRERCGRQLLPVTDLARLVLLRDALNKEGFDRAVWLDADVLVFDPERFSVEVQSDYAFCREFWLTRRPDGEAGVFPGVNNAMIAVRRGNPALDFLIRGCKEIVAQTDPTKLTHDAVGTHFLRGLAAVMPVPVLDRAGLLSPAVIHEMLNGGDMLARTLAAQGGALTAVNLCASMVGRAVHDVRLEEADMARAVAVLLDTRGAPFNRFCVTAA